MKPIIARSYAPYLTLMLWLVAVKLAIMAGPDSLRSPAQAAVFAWPFLGVLLVAGLVGLRLSRLVGVPELLDERVHRRRRFLEPAVVGLVLGSALLASDLGFDWSRPMAVGHGLESIHIPFPASALIYPGGAIIVCVIYYLLPIPLLTWAISRGLLRGRHTSRVFWIVGALCAAIEPLTQDLTPAMRALGGVAALVFAIDYAANLAQVVVFRRAGFLAAVTLRIAMYVVWHVLPSFVAR